MKNYGQMTKAELIRRLADMEKIAPGPSMAFAHERLTHDLQVQQIELETQNRELREAQLVLESSRARYADLYDFAPVGYVTLDSQGLILEANLTAAGMLGTERARLVGVPFHLHVMREDLAQFRAHLGRAAVPEQRVETEFRLLRKGQTDLPVAVQSVGVPGENGNGPVWHTTLTDITARKQAEESLRASEERQKLALEGADLALWDWHIPTGAVTFNERWSTMLGYRPEEMQPHARSWQERVHPDDWPAVQQAWADHRDGRTPSYASEHRLRHRDGHWIWVLDKGRVIERDAAGQAVRACGTYLDITRQKQAVEALRESEERFRGLFESMQEGCFLAEVICDHAGKPVDWRFLDMNAANEKTIGMKRADAIGRSARELFPGLEDHWFEAQAHTALTGEPAHLEGFTQVTGRSYDIHLYSPRRGQFACVSSDITTRIQAEEALRESEERFRQMSGAIDQVFWMTSLDKHEMLYISPAYERIWGRTCLSLYAAPHTWLDAVHPEDRPHLIEQATTQQVIGKYDVEYRIVRPDGTERWIRDRAFPVVDAAGKVLLVAGVADDITERKRAAAALGEAHEFSRQVIAGAQAGIVVCDRAGRLVVWNHFMKQLTGDPAAAVLGRPLEKALPLLGRRKFAPLFERALAGEVFAAPDIALDLAALGRKGWVAAHFAPWRNGRQEIVGFIATFRDVTARRRLEAELLEISDHEQRRIGHDLHDDLCQQLAAIEFRLEALRHELDAPSAAHTEILRIGAFVRESTSHARALARVLSPVEAGPEGLMLALQTLAAHAALLHRIECEYRCSAPVPVADPSAAVHLYRLAQEAIANAVKHGHAQRVRVTLAPAEEGGRLTVTDDGSGCPLPVPPGTGMGTRIMQYRAEMIGATLRLEPAPGGGLSVVCDFPTHTP